MRKTHFVAVSGFLVGLVLGAGGFAFAQAQRVSMPVQDRAYTITTDTAGNVISTTKSPSLAAEPVTLTNDALSLKVTGTHHGRLVGTLMAKVDGRWVEVQFAPQDSFASR